MLIPRSPRAPSLITGLVCLTLSTQLAATETQRNCAIGLSNDHFIVSAGYQGSVLDVLANDSGELDELTLVTVGQNTAAGGTVSVIGGKISYNPPSHFSGEDSFSYQVSENDWRSSHTSVPITLADAGALSGTTATGLPVIAAPPLTADTDWLAGVGAANGSVFARQMKLEADYTGCYQDSDPKFSVRIQWSLSKQSGATNPGSEFEASLSPIGNHPTAAAASQSYAWPASTVRQLFLDISDLSGSQLPFFKAGFFAQARDSYGDYTWRSESVEANGSITTQHCELCSREATVTITVDKDNDGDGVSDSLDVDDDNDGIPDMVEGQKDSDGDGIPNHQDLDSDNDGLLDVVEAGGISDSGDGRLNAAQDMDGDGWNDQAQSTMEPERDSDGDGVPDFLDLDSDNDGVPDVVEQGWPDAAPRDGRIDGYRDANGDGLHDLNIATGAALDTDGDGIANTLDLDADGDGVEDSLENELDSLDSNHDGRLDDLDDSNGNDIPDLVDAAWTGGADLNSNGIDDRFDARMQLTRDQDGDAIADVHDPDADGDGWLDTIGQFTAVDADGDGNADFLQASYSGRRVAPDADDSGNSSRSSAIAGIDGYGGCTLARGAGFDPVLILMALFSALYLFRRRSTGEAH